MEAVSPRRAGLACGPRLSRMAQQPHFSLVDGTVSSSLFAVTEGEHVSVHLETAYGFR